uniref:Uncharacterized protein n=1 Tax=Candidatus Kentrum sp. SD TaxID=2126332 RepID=A0A450Z297_9GAMM|nr:MAG: hypothetical protein BECKSD772F_GA0070984_111211 [Candidatus Kentron sp. SD]VFK47926.1 MAG: hypothetical protein BECKSD772E_GA0070983_110911 [Candidatus Kentron sp. SD]
MKPQEPNFGLLGLIVAIISVVVSIIGGIILKLLEGEFIGSITAVILIVVVLLSPIVGTIYWWCRRWREENVSPEPNGPSEEATDGPNQSPMLAICRLLRCRIKAKKCAGIIVLLAAAIGLGVWLLCCDYLEGFIPKTDVDTDNGVIREETILRPRPSFDVLEIAILPSGQKVEVLVDTPPSSLWLRVRICR